MWNKELEAAIAVAQAAGEEILKIYNSPDTLKIDLKADRSPLTEADRSSNRVIVPQLQRNFPNYAILSEEEQDDKTRLDNDYCFIIDPLDGTKEFIKRNGQFTVNIALAYKQVSVMGVIYVPVTCEIFYAAKGEGAFVKHADGKTAELHVTDNKDIPSLRVVMSNSHGCKQMDELLQKYNLKNFVKVGSSLKGCMVASGEADIYYRFNPTMEWDTAAMQCIVEEAGGIFKQMDNSEMRYNRENCLNDKGFYAVNCEENVFV